jgi:hypothetical protein
VRRHGVVLVLGMLGTVLTACTAARTGQASGTTSAATPPPTVVAAVMTPSLPAGAAPTPLAAKPLPPLEVRLDLDPPDLSVGLPVTVTTTITPGASAPRTTSRLEATGIVVVEEGPVGQWNDLPLNQQVVTHGRIRLTGCGEGEIRATVDVTDAAGQSLYGRSAMLYVLAMGDVVLTGAAGPLLLRLEYLDRQQQAGALTPAEYAQARDRVLGGGAQDSGGTVPAGLPVPGSCGPR